MAELMELKIEANRSARKEDVASEYGRPTRIKSLEDANSLCRERWYYDGQSDFGFGLLDVAMYIDFDDQGSVCEDDAENK